MLRDAEISAFFSMFNLSMGSRVLKQKVGYSSVIIPSSCKWVRNCQFGHTSIVHAWMLWIHRRVVNLSTNDDTRASFTNHTFCFFKAVISETGLWFWLEPFFENLTTLEVTLSQKGIRSRLWHADDFCHLTPVYIFLHASQNHLVYSFLLLSSSWFYT